MKVSGQLQDLTVNHWERAPGWKAVRAPQTPSDYPGGGAAGHFSTAQKTTVLIFTAVRTSHPTGVVAVIN